MKPLFQRLLTAYQPLRQRGLLLDGRQPAGTAPPVVAARRPRITLAALTGLRHFLFPPEDSP
ncbi:hypothetical protein [Rhodanobacter sp. Root627]|uniref:hypothetical protein n=1 Tax=Rhodanobacter sp. Root627 TaxID=1736572 RepID=UPI000AAEC45E|nr:hypothetical protein [Rhodanobacter sp. Root627]